MFPFFYLTSFPFIFTLASKKDNNTKRRGSEDPSEDSEECSEEEAEKKPKAKKLTRDACKYCVSFYPLIYHLTVFNNSVFF